MQEIRILELFIVFLILVPLIRPFVKDMQALEGLVWFPPLALVSIIALFPVYGFRPECIPLLILVVILNIRNFSSLISLLKRLHRDTFQYLALGHTVVVIFFLVVTAVIALYFAPVTNTALTDKVATVTVRDEARNVEFFLRIYGSQQPNRPLMLLVPPVIGSITMVDKVCAELEAQGFTVIAYSRRNFDSPSVGERGQRYGSPLGMKIQFLQACILGTAFEKPNAWGRNFEKERKTDILFLLTYIKEEGLTTDKDTLFLAGYGTGGSALVLIGESPEYIEAHPQVKGLIVVESPLWSIYQVEERYPLKPPEEAVEWFKTLWSSITNGTMNLLPKKIIGIERIPRPGLPTLFIVSDRAANPRHRERRYRPLVRILQTPTQAALVTVDGAGILDYSDYPAKYPLYAAIFSGSKPEHWKNEECIEGTASLMANFAALVLAPIQPDSVKYLKPQKRLLEENIHFETTGVWNLPPFGYILSP